ncbi:MgtC/SapB family protein [archaeon]|jgi:uncharacterized membrane protein (DUF4010 family)|nr:MgtC/SapB family protein [archaeon]MBT3577749.1 MgtC/SapB family protein [archaeon]MBT6820756.1 MgtC/SapB family protein [archaeon]MBT6956433.1 MgtC/SapB family protein [archaeon]MBT7025896.1 MgtC/SapB family protein [archaeon]
MEVMGFLVAIMLGALIGLQREYEQYHTQVSRFAGIRTFILISLFGAILGFLSLGVVGNYYLVIVGFIVVSLFALASYFVTFLKYKQNTSTTEITAIIVFILGFMCVAGFLIESVILGILVAAFLTFKKKLHKFANKIKRKELFAVVEFALIALVVLPLLPRRVFSPLDVPILKDVLSSAGLSTAIMQQLNLFNPYNFWLMVILVAGISFLGYILVKTLGAKKGYGLTGLVGGLVSSTAVTLSMAGESKRHKRTVSPFVVAVVIASATSFIRILLEVVVINKDLVGMVALPLGLMGILGYMSAFGLYLRKKRKPKKKEKTEEIKFKQPFNIWTALKFGIFFVVIIFVAKIAQILAGSTGIYIASILSGLADVDAITLTMASLSGAGQISSKVAATSIILAASSNTLVKAGMAWFFGEKRFAMYISIIFLIILTVGLGSVFLFL